MNIQIGDRITFRAVTRDGAPKLTRVVNGWHKRYAMDGCTVLDTWPTVRAHGTGGFIVRPGEISAINGVDL